MNKTIATLLCCLLCVLAVQVPAHAASPQDVVAVVTTFLQERTRDTPGAVSISVKPLSERQLTLERCAQLQAFLPQGQQAWARVTVGVRCVNGPNGTLFINAEVKVEGSFVTMARPVSGGQVLSDGDVQIEHGELTAHPADLVLTLKDAIGQSTKQALSPGQALRSVYLQHENSIRAGQSVRVVANGNGFSVVNHGRALNNAARGELIRVKLDDGQILNGIAADAGSVDVSGTH